MFIGHFGVALVAKKKAPRAPLALLFLAAQLLDYIWPLLVFFGVEYFSIDPGNTSFTPLNFENYPYSHSLLMVLGWSVILGGIYYYFAKNYKSAIVVGLLVTSHWVLDFITHRPDLPLYPGGEDFYGLGLWNSVAGTVFIESLIFAGGVYLYIKSAAHFKPKYFWSLISMLVILYIGNLFSPPPPSVEMVTYSALVLWLFIPWAWAVEPA